MVKYKKDVDQWKYRAIQEITYYFEEINPKDKWSDKESKFIDFLEEKKFGYFDDEYSQWHWLLDNIVDMDLDELREFTALIPSVYDTT